MSLLLLLLASLVATVTTPDFSGAWRLDLSRSDFGELPAPQSMTTRVDHREPLIQVASSVTTIHGTSNTSYTYRTDGSPQTNTVRGTVVISKAKWSKALLVVEVTARTRSGELRFTDKWELSEDRKTLIISRTMESSQGPASQRYVYEREGN
jgi:hypothetical protein